MKSFQFSIRVYIKGTRITPFIMPRDGMYRCHWSDTGICHFDNVENGYAELHSRLDDHFHMDQPTSDDAIIEYYDRLAETLMAISSQADFVSALLHSSQTYSPFSLVLKVNAIRREEHWFNGEEVAFDKVWRVSKPKFACIRSWLMSLEREGSVCKDISETCSYSERSFLFSQLSQIKEGYSTNQDDLKSTNQSGAGSNLHQSKAPKSTLTSINSGFELLEPGNANQKMLHAKMMMDPVISLVLFNEYIPLKQPAKKPEQEKKEEEALCGEMGGLFLGKMEEEAVKEKEAQKEGGLFIRSEPASFTSEGGLFIRSEDSTASPDCEDWVIA